MCLVTAGLHGLALRAPCRRQRLGFGRRGDIANFTTIAESLDPETFMGMLTLGHKEQQKRGF